MENERISGTYKMRNISSVVLSKYQDTHKYQDLGNGIYKDLENKRFVITLRFELEQNDDSQYPLEDILDKYYVNCTSHIVHEEIKGVSILETEIEDGNDNNFESLATIQKIASLVGKRIYLKEDGQYLRLTIE